MKVLHQHILYKMYFAFFFGGKATWSDGLQLGHLACVLGEGEGAMGWDLIILFNKSYESYCVLRYSTMFQCENPGELKNKHHEKF